MYRPPGLPKAVPRELACPINMVIRVGRRAVRKGLPCRLKLDDHSGEALREGVVHIPGHAISLFQYGIAAVIFTLHQVSLRGNAILEERNRMARDMHDTLAQ